MSSNSVLGIAENSIAVLLDLREGWHEIIPKRGEVLPRQNSSVLRIGIWWTKDECAATVGSYDFRLLERRSWVSRIPQIRSSLGGD